MALNNVPGGCWEEWKGCCCCSCSLFQIFVSLDEWSDVNKPVASSRHAAKGKNTLTKAQQQKKAKKDAIPSVLPTQQNEMTQLVMTYMGDILDESDEDYDSEDDEEEEFDVVDLKTNANGNNKSTGKQTGNYQSLPNDTRESSHLPTRIDLLQVTIPPGHSAGSIFEIENTFGEILEVVVPQGGKPGMKMQVPNKAPLPQPPSANQQNSNPIMVQDGNLQVTIPPNHFAGSMFYIQSSRGDVMEVVVPAGGKPGMKMQIPNSFSQLLTRPEPPVPPRKDSPPPEGGETARQQKPLLPTGDSKKKKKLHKQKSGASTRSTSPSGARVIQVTIPEGCYEGSIFELRPTNGKGENIKVRVPKGGKPGLRVQIRVPSQPSTAAKKNTPLRKQQPVMRDSPKSKDKVTRHAFGSYGGGGKPITNNQPHTASVTVPQGVSEGEPFVALDGNTGQQVLVIMPKGAVPGTVIDTPIVHDT
jgi:hypothetical protein